MLLTMWPKEGSKHSHGQMSAAIYTISHFGGMTEMGILYYHSRIKTVIS